MSARDLGTGRAQEITITASSNMSQAEIDRAVREAQQYAREDAQLKAEATAKDRCEHLMYQAASAKVDKPAKQRLAEAVKQARQAIKSKNPAAMNQAADELERVLNEVGYTVDPNASYRADASYANPVDDTDDDAMDADFEPM